jgi:NAD(P)H-dependent flavin oxidoreductase YrpB (nitropropane dioxygenase family)
MPFTNAFMERFGLSIPIVQAPMLGATDSRIDALSLWAGQGVNAIREMPTADLVRVLWDETREALAVMQKRMG